ncbi:5' nucleotidase, NT5C type [Hymenobacter metallicola]|nr:hypothetical protein [Hymenobacter metallicola]
MSEKVIFCDVDGVVADLGPEWVRRYNADYNDNLCYKTGVTGWDMTPFVKPECGQKIYNYLHDKTLYDGVQPIEGSVEGVARLRELGFRVVFATSTNVHMAGRKLLWLAEHGFLDLKYGTLSPDYMEVHDKSLLHGGALIDDGEHNLKNFCGIRILFSARHNAAVNNPSFFRVNNWKEVVDQFVL